MYFCLAIFKEKSYGLSLYKKQWKYDHQRFQLALSEIRKVTKLGRNYFLKDLSIVVIKPPSLKIFNQFLKKFLPEKIKTISFLQDISWGYNGFRRYSLSSSYTIPKVQQKISIRWFKISRKDLQIIFNSASN